MTRPDFEAVAAKGFDGCLKKLFLDGLGYYTIEKDADEKDPERPDAWRMIVPIKDSLPFAIAYQKGLGSMERQGISKLYIDPVLRHRDGNPSVTPVLYGFGDGARFVFFSADPARNRDDRFELSAATWEFRSVQDKFSRLHSDQLVFQSRLGRKRPLVDFLFEGHPLSADERFKRYVHVVRQELMRAVLDERKALAAIVYHLLEAPEARQQGKTHFVTKDGKLKKSLEDLHLELGMRLGDAIGAAVDTLLLRYLMIRFLESYHPEAMDGLLASKELLARGKGGKKTAPPKGTKGAAATLTLFEKRGTAAATFTEVELQLAERLTEPLGIDVSKAKKKAKGTDELQRDLFVFEDEQTLAETVLSEEEKRKSKLGGDFYLADLGRAAQAVEEALLSHPKSNGAKLLQDFLGRTGAPEMAHWDFRYEDLKPQALQDYYESSLGTAVQLSWDEKRKDFELAVGRTQHQRKELGAYYTDSRLCRFMVEHTVKPIFEKRLEVLRKALNGKDVSASRAAFNGIIGFAVCDPTMGSAPFLRSAFDCLSEQYLPLCRVIAESKSLLPPFFDDVSREFPFLALRGGRMEEEGVGQWEWHILRRMLYGLDVDLKAVCIACQTFALSALKYLKHGERFPSFFNLNLKLGNALISPVRAADRPRLAKDYGKAISKLIRLRRQAMALPNDDNAYDRLAGLLAQIDEIKNPIVRDLVQDRLAPIFQETTESLRPFCWELEFPELFFAPDGTLLDEGGFDVMVGNPPWNNIKPDDREFFEALDPAFREGKTRAARDRRVERLRRKQTVDHLYLQYLSVIERWNQFIRSGDAYSYQRPTFEHLRVFKIDNNLYKLTLEHAWYLTKGHAAIGLLVPLGFASDLGASALRQLYFDGAACRGLWGFDKNANVFPITQAVLCVLFEKKGDRSAFPYVTGLSSVDALLELNQQQTLPSITTDLIRRTAPEIYAVPEVETPEDLEILRKLYTYAPLFETKPSDPWIARPARELHTTDDRDLFRNRDTGIPLLKGDDIDQFAIREPISLWADKNGYRERGKDSHASRIAWRDVAGVNDRRRLYCTLIPPGYALLNSLGYIIPEQDEAVKLFLVGLLNSFVLEYRVRQLSKNNHVNQFVVANLPIPRLEDGDPRFDAIVRIVRDLLKAGGDLAKCSQLDAEVASLYGLSKNELSVLLTRFPKVEDGIKRAILAAFDNLEG